MLKNYFKVTLRSLIKFKVYLLVNIFGLSIGIACTILAGVFIIDEQSFDRFHVNADNIYRVNKYYTNDAGVTNKASESSGQMGPQMQVDFPGVKQFVRFQPWFGDEIISYGDINLKEELVAFADSNFFKMFDFELLQGDPDLVLRDPRSMVLTASMADKLFGDKDPIGEVVDLLERKFVVTGISKDVPRNSHIQYEVLVSWSSTLGGEGNLNYSFFNNWLAQALNTYVEIQPGADILTLEEKMAGMLATHLPERTEDYKLYLQHFPEIYLKSEDIPFGNTKLRLGSQRFSLIFNFIAAFVLLIAAVNYINISTAKAMRRSLEVGVRKVLGASKKQLFIQFLGEALLITTLSGLLAILIVDISIPYFNELVDKQLTNTLLFEPKIVLLSIGVVLLTSLISGAYPALALASFQPSAVLKTGKGNSIKGGLARKVMIVFQFSLASVMITSALIVFSQNDFLLNKDVGLDGEQVLVVELKGESDDNSSLIEQELLKHPDILNVSSCNVAIGGGSFGTTVIPEGFTNPVDVRYFRVDFDFVDVYGIEMNQGRNFDPKIATDRNAVVINKSMADLIGWEDAVSKKIKFQENQPELAVIGVVEDFHYTGLNYSKVDPVVMYIDERPGYLSIRVSGNNMRGVIDQIDNVYSSFEAKYPFEYYFVDKWFAKQYKSEQNFFSIITIFTVLCIAISCLGLYGLVSYFIEQRVKEIGIRKVLGASIASIALMINRHFIRLIVISLIVSVPVSFWLMQSWLEGFVYRIDIGFTPFILSALLITFIALLTTNKQAISASKRNPVQSLKSE
jgi:putative ABC transport system permease protein